MTLEALFDVLDCVVEDYTSFKPSWLEPYTIKTTSNLGNILEASTYEQSNSKCVQINNTDNQLCRIK